MRVLTGLLMGLWIGAESGTDQDERVTAALLVVGALLVWRFARRGKQEEGWPMTKFGKGEDYLFCLRSWTALWFRSPG